MNEKFVGLELTDLSSCQELNDFEVLCILRKILRVSLSTMGLRPFKNQLSKQSPIFLRC